MKRTEVIRKLINSTGLSVKAFAAKVGLPYSTLRSMLERGIGNASVDNVIRVCKGLNGVQEVAGSIPVTQTIKEI